MSNPYSIIKTDSLEARHFDRPAAVPIAGFGAPNVLASAGPIRCGSRVVLQNPRVLDRLDHRSGDHVATQAPAIPQLAAEEGNEMYWAQLSGGRAINPSADRVAPFDNEAAQIGLGRNVERHQTVNNSLEHNV